jgi:hypothetical protein
LSTKYGDYQLEGGRCSNTVSAVIKKVRAKGELQFIKMEEL